MLNRKPSLFGGALLAVGMVGASQADTQRFVTSPGGYGLFVFAAENIDSGSTVINSVGELSLFDGAVRFSYNSSGAFVTAGATEDNVFLRFSTPQSYESHNHSVFFNRLIPNKNADLLISWDLTEFSGFPDGGDQVNATILVADAGKPFDESTITLLNLFTPEPAEAFTSLSGSIRVPVRVGQPLRISLALRMPDSEPSLGVSGLLQGELNIEIVPKPEPDTPPTSEQIADVDRDGDADLDDILLYFAAFADFSQQP